MGPRTWRRVKDVYSAARELPPAGREAFVERIASDHPAVVKETLRLLKLDDGAEERIAAIGLPQHLIASAAERRAFHPGERPAGRYEIRRFLAAGGMGEVYEADDLERGERIAIKALRAEFATADHVSWLRREIQAARRVNHPNVCRVFELVETGRAVFLTMELLEGETLAALLIREGALPERRALPLIRQTVAGLAAAHRANVIHRDLKPANIMIVPRRDGAPRVVITDFGLARAPMAGRNTTYDSRTFTAAFGTPSYMAPEQVQGKAPGAAADIYALGAVMYEMVTGEVPFAGDSALSVVVRKTTEVPEQPRLFAPALRPTWNTAIMRCLRVNPARRFQRANDVLISLETGSRSTLRWRMFRRGVRRFVRSRAFAAAIVLLALAATVGIAGIWRAEPAPEARMAWDRAISSLHGDEPLVAARLLEEAMAAHRLPPRAHADLALAWSELGFRDRAEAELGRMPFWLSQTDRVYKAAALARIRGDRESGFRMLAGLAPGSAAAPLAADRAWFGSKARSTKDRWSAVAAQRPAYAAAHLQLAEAAAAEGKWRAAEREFLTAQTYYMAQANLEMARAVAARRGMRRLQAGQAELALEDLSSLPRPPSGSGAGPCERVIVLTAGVADNFAAPPDPIAYISPKFSGMPGANVRSRQFDDAVIDQQFHLSIPLPPVRVCSGKLEARVRASSQLPGASNDFLVVGAAPLNDTMSPSIQIPLWRGDEDPGAHMVFTELRADLFANVMRAYAGAAVASLDISGSDDTDFDYIRLTIIY